ncbi:MAG: carboxypeptidase-like regulatory domain-containing protein [Bacteroidales bacterium]|nr:carboxypeptidase-like regulatory domain-containing protein [Bacteroidales bacterium]
MWPTGLAERKWILIAGLLLITPRLYTQENVLDDSVKIAGNTIRAGRALNEVSRLTGYIFTYDTEIINADRSFIIPDSEIPVRQVLDSVTANPEVKYSVIGKHIILYRDIIEEPRDTAGKTLPDWIFITGRITDATTSDPLPYATISISHRGRGTVTNNNGDFILKISDECLSDTLSVSYVGYINRRIPVRSLPGNSMVISLERDYIPIPEIIIRSQDPLLIIRNTVASVAENYGTSPALLTGFYREGVYRKKEPQVYSEAVVQIYKSPYARSLQSDQVKVLRSRKIENLEVKDTLAVRLKAGLGSTLTLDIIRQLFDFLDPQSFESYEYHLTDIVTIDDQTAFVISFKQRPWITEPLMQGDVYINVDNYAVVLAEFELNPGYIDQTSEAYVSRLPRDYVMKPEYVRYRTHYRLVNGRYYLSHVRGDLGFLAKGRKRLFNSHFNVFFELAVTDHRLNNVTRFEHDETAPVYSVFSRTITGYDSDFWRDFDFLKPEEDLMEALVRLNVRLGEAEE